MPTEDSMDKAAAAFDAVLNDTNQPNRKPVPKAPPVTERMFDAGFVDDGDDVAGGDDLPAPGETEEPPKKRRDDDGDDEDDQAEEAGDVDGDEEEDDTTEEAGDDDPEGEGNDVYRVLVEGEEKEVSLKEALDGYIRTETFHRRLNKLSEAQSELTEQYQALTDDRKKYEERLTDLDKTFKELIPVEPDWDKMYSEDPAGARKMQKQYQDLQGRLDGIRKERERVTKEQADADASNLAKYAKTELERFFAHDKKWTDAKALRKDLDAMRETAFNLGFTEQEVARVYDSRMLKVLLKASKYDRLMAARPVPVKRGKSPVKPGTGSNGTVQRGSSQAMKRLSRTGSIDDAASVFQNIISRR